MKNLKSKKTIYLFLSVNFLFSPILFLNSNNNFFDENNEINNESRIELNENQKLNVDLGGEHSGLLVDEKFYIWGNNKYGQLGIGTTSNISRPRLLDVDGDGIRGEEKIIDINLGLSSTFVLIDNGNDTNSLYTWGRNDYGQLGDGSSMDMKSPILIDVDGDGIKGNEKIKDISFSGTNALLTTINSDGTNTLYSWGQNYEGQLGNGDSGYSSNVYVPESIDLDGDGTIGNEKIVDISMGASHSSAVLDNGNGTNTLYTWGKNDYGQLGNGVNGDNLNVLKPKSIDLDGDGTIGNEKIVDVNFSFYCSSAITNNGNGTNTLYVWGQNNWGQLGNGVQQDPNNIQNVLKPLALDVDNDGTIGNEDILFFDFGDFHSSAVLDNGDGTNTLYTWGLNSSGQLGLEISSSWFNDDHYEVLPTGIDLDGDGIVGNEKILDVSLGAFHSSAILNSGDTNYVYIWGKNSSGQLGDGGFYDFRDVPMIMSFSINSPLNKIIYITIFSLVIITLILLIFLILIKRRKL